MKVPQGFCCLRLPGRKTTRQSTPVASARLDRALRPIVGKYDFLLDMQQAMALGDIVDVGRFADDRVYQPRFSVHPDIGLHSKVPLIALLGLVHFGITLSVSVSVFVSVFGGGGSGNEGGVDYSATLEHEALHAELVIDDLQDAHPIGDPARAGQATKIVVDRHLEQSFFGCKVRQPEPLLQAMDTQHHLQIGSGRQVLAAGSYAAINATSSAHGIACLISSISTSLRVRRVLRFRPGPLLFYASIVWQTCLSNHCGSCRVLNMIPS